MRADSDGVEGEVECCTSVGLLVVVEVLVVEVVVGEKESGGVGGEARLQG
jgi:hypothetical protein